MQDLEIPKARSHSRQYYYLCFFLREITGKLDLFQDLRFIFIFISLTRTSTSTIFNNFLSSIFEFD